MGDYLPILPQKRYTMSGSKKSGDEMQSELTEWMREMLQINKLQRMFYLRLFLSVNAYPEEIFNGASGALQDDLVAQTQSYSPMHGGHNNEHISLIRESQDISNIVMQSFRTTTDQEEPLMNFENNGPPVLPGNMQTIPEMPGVN